MQDARRLQTMKTKLFRHKLTVCSFGFVLACLALTLSPVSAQSQAPDTNSFAFTVTCDMRQFVGPASAGKRFFDGACEAIQRIGGGAFMIVPGDFDPPGPVRATIDQFLGTNYVWYPVPGNHDAEKPDYMVWLRNWASNGIPHLVRRGPAGSENTMYSWDYANSHFAAINQYYDGHSDAAGKGDFNTAQLDWLAEDLAATRKPLVWVVGHVPIEAQPDMEVGRLRHKTNLSEGRAERERFVGLLKQYHACAYLCGHTHNTSAVKVQGIWQVDAGHARGAGDKDAPSTFLKIRVAGTQSWVDIYRADANGDNYQLKRTAQLN